MRFPFKQPKGQWVSSEEPSSAYARLRISIGDAWARTHSQADAVMTGSTQRISPRVISAGEILLDMTQTPWGRLLVSALALSFAWLLLGS